MPDPKDECVWEQGWDGHERAQRLRLARLPLIDKLLWLEQAQELADRLVRAHGRTDTKSEA